MRAYVCESERACVCESESVHDSESVCARE